MESIPQTKCILQLPKREKAVNYRDELRQSFFAELQKFFDTEEKRAQGVFSSNEGKSTIHAPFVLDGLLKGLSFKEAKNLKGTYVNKKGETKSRAYAWMYDKTDNGERLSNWKRLTFNELGNLDLLVKCYEAVDKDLGLSMFGGTLCTLDFDVPKDIEDDREAVRDYLVPRLNTITEGLKGLSIGYLFEPTRHGAHLYMWQDGSVLHCVEAKGVIFGVEGVGCFLPYKKQLQTCLNKDYRETWITCLPNESPYKLCHTYNGTALFRAGIHTDKTAHKVELTQPDGTTKAVEISTSDDVAKWRTNSRFTVGNRNSLTFSCAIWHFMHGYSRQQIVEIIVNRQKKDLGEGGVLPLGEIQTTIDSAYKTDAVQSYLKAQAKKVDTEKELESWLRHVSIPQRVYRELIENVCFCAETQELIDFDTRLPIGKDKASFELWAWDKLCQMFNLPMPSGKVQTDLQRYHNFSPASLFSSVCKRVKRGQDFQPYPHTRCKNGRVVWFEEDGQLHCDDVETYMDWLRQSDYPVVPPPYKPDEKRKGFSFNDELYEKYAHDEEMPFEAVLGELRDRAPLYYSILANNVRNSEEYGNGQLSILEHLGLALCPMLNSSGMATMLQCYGPTANNGKSTLLDYPLSQVDVSVKYKFEEGSHIDGNVYGPYNVLMANDNQQAGRLASRELLLQVAAGESMTGNVKFAPNGCLLTAKRLMVFMANKQITIAKDEGLHRRVNCVYFMQAPEEIPLELKRHKPTMTEVNDLLTLGLVALHYALKRGSVTRVNQGVECERDGVGVTNETDSVYLHIRNNLDKYIFRSSSEVQSAIIRNCREEVEDWIAPKVKAVYHDEPDLKEMRFTKDGNSKFQKYVLAAHNLAFKQTWINGKNTFILSFTGVTSTPIRKHLVNLLADKLKSENDFSLDSICRARPHFNCKDGRAVLQEAIDLALQLRAQDSPEPKKNEGMEIQIHAPNHTETNEENHKRFTDRLSYHEADIAENDEVYKSYLADGMKIEAERYRRQRATKLALDDVPPPEDLTEERIPF